MKTLKDGTPIEILIMPVWTSEIALVRFPDGREEFVSMDQIEEEE